MKDERLTGKRRNGTYFIKKCDKKSHCDGYCGSCNVDDEIRKHLGELEDKIESGKIIEPEFAIGDEVYWLFDLDTDEPSWILKMVDNIHIYGGIGIEYEDNNGDYFTDKDIGKTIFHTQDEAEKRLKELKEQKENAENT